MINGINITAKTELSGEVIESIVDKEFKFKIETHKINADLVREGIALIALVQQARIAEAQARTAEYEVESLRAQARIAEADAAKAKYAAESAASDAAFRKASASAKSKKPYTNGTAIYGE